MNLTTKICRLFLNFLFIRFGTLLVLLGIFLNSCSKEESAEPELGCSEKQFYHYQGEKQDLSSSLLGRYFLIGMDIDMTYEEISDFLFTFEESMQIVQVLDLQAGHHDNYKHKQVLVLLSSGYSCEQFESLFKSLEQFPEVIYSTFTYDAGLFICCDRDGTDFIFEVRSYGNDFLVKLKKLEDKVLLEKMAADTKTTIQHQFAVPMQQVFVLTIDKNSLGSALEMANYFHESGKFEFTDPNNFYYDLGYGDVPLKH